MMDPSNSITNRLTGDKSPSEEQEQVVKVDERDKNNENKEEKDAEKSIKCHGSDDNNDDDDEEDMFERLLPPTPDYTKGNPDEDLDSIMGIEMKAIANSETADANGASAAVVSDELATNAPKTCCVRKYGNTIILNTTVHNKTRYGLIGPHYFGVLSTVGLLSFGSFYFTKKAFDDIGVKSGLIGCLFTLMAFYNLLRTVCVDPGIVKREDQIVRRVKKDQGEAGEKEYETVFLGVEEGWRYCGLCSAHQPPKAVHCPDCNVCVDGYDHHCPWMGICIGKKNMGSFVCFNLTWLAFLIYSCIWVVALGPLVAKRKAGGD